MKNVYDQSDQQYKRFPEPVSMKFQGQAQTSSTSLDPPFLQGCCCFSLRTGCLIYGWLGIIFSITGAVLFGVLDYFILNYAKEMKKNHDLDNDDAKSNEIVATVVAIMFIVIIVVAFMLCLCYMILLIGVYKKKTILLKIFLVLAYISLVLSFFEFIRSLSTGHINIEDCAIRIVYYIWSIFNILVVHCYHRELQIELMGTPIIHSAPVIHSAPPRYEP